MRSILLRAYNYFYSTNELCPGTLRTKSMVQWTVFGIMRRTLRFLFRLYMQVYKLMGRYPDPLKGRKDIVVSLTSFPKRIGLVWITIDSLFHQKVQPGSIRLYLTNVEFPEGRRSLPKRLLAYERLGLEIHFCEENLMPHVKYHYAMQELPDDALLITVDDDLHYYPQTIEYLVQLHEQYPDCVCSNRVKSIPFQEGKPIHYDEWPLLFSPVPPSINHLALGYGGVLYPVHLFKGAKEMFDTAMIKKLSLRADDLWLKVMETRLGIPVVNGPYLIPGISVLGSQEVSLMSVNTGSEGLNDVQWAQMEEVFHQNELLLHAKD